MSEATDPLAETLLAKAAEDEAVLQLDQVPTGPFASMLNRRWRSFSRRCLHNSALAWTGRTT